MDAVALPACKVVRLPPLQHEPEAVPSALIHIPNLLGSSQITVSETPEIAQQVNTVWECGVVWRVVLEHCIIHI